MNRRLRRGRLIDATTTTWSTFATMTCSMSGESSFALAMIRESFDRRGSTSSMTPSSGRIAARTSSPTATGSA